MRAYDNALRWGRYPEAESFQRYHFNQPDFDYLRDIQVTSYEVVGMRPGEDEFHVHQTAEIRFYHKEYSTEHTILDQQDWVWDEEQESWLLEGGMPDFKPTKR